MDECGSAPLVVFMKTMLYRLKNHNIMWRTNTGPTTASRIVLSLMITGLVVLAGCDRSDTPYDQGYEFGYQMGQASRNVGGDPDISDAKNTAAHCQNLKKENGTHFELGSPEYGDYMRGVEDGYIDGYR